jgi:tol-pal system protein YbgF
MNKPTLTAALIALLVPAVAPAQDLDGRVTRIENILENQRSSDLLLQVQRLQQEVQQLRGMVEQQQFELANLKRLQNDQYTDLDSRLRGQGGVAPSPAAAAPEAGARPTDVMLTPPAASAPPAATGETGAVPGLAPPPAEAGSAVSEKEAYRNAFDLLKQRRYDDAALAFEELLRLYPNGDLADNGRYWLGETKYVKRDFGGALAEFRLVLNDYPMSPKIPGAMLKIGYIQDERKDWSDARATLQQLVEKFPDSTEARLAKGRLERMARDGH